MDSSSLLRHFGRHLREARVRRNLSQEQLAARAGLSRNFIGMLERGERNITIVSIEKLASVLNMDRWELLRF